MSVPLYCDECGGELLPTTGGLLMCDDCKNVSSYRRAVETNLERYYEGWKFATTQLDQQVSAAIKTNVMWLQSELHRIRSKVIELNDSLEKLEARLQATNHEPIDLP